jgi:HSP20 family molecular chaperone IbpA
MLMQASPNSQPSPSSRAEPAVLPPVDIVEDPGGITVTADLPGVSPDDLVVRVDGRNLTLEAPLRLGEADSLAFVYSEVRANRYRRSFELSGELDTTAIQAELKDGVLKLRLPKVERAKPRRVEVRAAP